MIQTGPLETYCDELLNAPAFDDYCPNGLQVDAGTGEIRKIVTGVTASMALIEAAAAADADLLLVHHGYFWKGEAPTLTGIKGRRVRLLMREGINLLAYHLPLDAHPELGNNRTLGNCLEFRDPVVLPGSGGLIWTAELPESLSPAALSRRINDALGREPMHISGGRKGPIRRVGWCTGAAQGYLEQAAAAAGMDAFISGEISEQTVHLAREWGIHYFAAGHHATERFGVQALGEHLEKRFGLHHQFIEIPNPV